MRTHLDYIAYAGKCFVIEWYVDTHHKSPALDYYRKLSRVKAGKYYG